MESKTVTVKLTRSAQNRLDTLAQPLNVELELYFSCLLRLRVIFPDQPGDDYIPVAVSHEKLKVYFHPVMTKHCVVDDIRGRDPDTVTFPIKKPEKFIPRWVKLDFKHGNWSGEFGY
ncbi:MAG: hypothetical protein L0Z73_02965 [Gammaproteobacteria bacterium]|nr:hypothetical protein [Gammaproteobacteria bacterium]